MRDAKQLETHSAYQELAQQHQAALQHRQQQALLQQHHQFLEQQQMPPPYVPPVELDSANKKIEALAAQINQMSVDTLQLKRSVVLNPPPASNLSAYPEHSLPSYLDPTHPLNADPTPLAIWQFEDKQLVDCNEPFARMLGYDGVPEFLLSFNVLTFYDIIAASIREKVVQTCADAFAKSILQTSNLPKSPKFRNSESQEISENLLSFGTQKISLNLQTSTNL
eukprot:Phypoly_transcript_06807.p1 GENE.Phypoly_transcript_06807~~Phypoly_transcript_06807.p1  ORF type:complete len:223 (+),score=48.01 Phypoly_transcript_06807:394-1062(+)